jgi:hypothetical protein
MTEEHGEEIVHRQLDTDRKDPAAAIAEVVADLDGRSTDDLPSTYSQVDGMLDNLFTDPPVPEAQMEVSFTYAGYRVTVGQDGNAKFVRVE